MQDFWKRKIIERLLDLSRQGMTAETIAQSIAVGVVLGVFPIFGFPTILCAVAAFALRLNLPALQFVNYLSYPLQIALLIPFLRIGQWLFRASPASTPVLGVLTVGLHAVVAWFCVCVPAGLILYIALAAILRRHARQDRQVECLTDTIILQIRPAGLL